MAPFRPLSLVYIQQVSLASLTHCAHFRLWRGREIKNTLICSFTFTVTQIMHIVNLHYHLASLNMSFFLRDQPHCCSSLEIPIHQFNPAALLDSLSRIHSLCPPISSPTSHHLLLPSSISQPNDNISSSPSSIVLHATL